MIPHSTPPFDRDHEHKATQSFLVETLYDADANESVRLALHSMPHTPILEAVHDMHRAMYPEEHAVIEGDGPGSSSCTLQANPPSQEQPHPANPLLT